MANEEIQGDQQDDLYNNMVRIILHIKLLLLQRKESKRRRLFKIKKQSNVKK